MSTRYLLDIVKEQKAGKASGIYSVCSANEYVIKAALKMGREDGAPVLIEATCNQVNQFGGYTGMKPGDFKEYVERLAADVDASDVDVILGGDHLGPYPFRKNPSAKALDLTGDMLREFVEAGFQKIHLDASYNTLDDELSAQGRLPVELIAERCAIMAEVCEKAFAESGTGLEPPVYIIGTEVPVPGGCDLSDLQITRPSDADETIELTRAAFFRKKLDRAWERVLGIVVQPGVEHADDEICEYDRINARTLTNHIAQKTPYIMEGHTTDFQTHKKLKEMVEDGIAILKTGQSQTYTAREAVCLLEEIEKIMFKGKLGTALSNFIEILNEMMTENDIHWKSYYGSKDSNFKKVYSYYDRQRYYWSTGKVRDSIEILFNNLRNYEIPLSLLSQYFPLQYRKVRLGTLSNDPEEILIDRIMEHMREYSYAVGFRDYYPE